jgi:HEAT repeat protein
MNREHSMKTPSQWLLIAAFSWSAASALADGPVTPEYTRKGELSPGASAPSQEALVGAIENGSPEKLKALLEYGERVVCEACVPLLQAKLLGSGDARVREMSAWWLRRQPFAAPMLLVKLKEALKNDDRSVRRARAAEALGEFMDPHALPALADAALQDKEAEVRVAAVKALARLNDQAAGPIVADALKDGAKSVRLAALEVITVTQSFRDFDALLPLLGDDDAAIRLRAARLTGERRVRAAEPVLIAMLEGDESPGARKAAAWALGRIGGADGQAALAKAADDQEEDVGVRSAIRIAQRMPVRF